MMNVGAADARAMSLWEYEARLYHWNEAHKTDKDQPKSDPAKMERLIAKLKDNPDLLAAKPKAAGDPEQAKMA